MKHWDSHQSDQSRKAIGTNTKKYILVFCWLLNITTLVGLSNSPYQCGRYYSWFLCQPSMKYIIYYFSLSVTINYLSFNIVCHHHYLNLSVISIVVSFPVVHYFQSSTFSIDCHSPLSVTLHCLSFSTVYHATLPVIFHCLSCHIACHLPIIYYTSSSVIPHCFSFIIIVYHSTLFLIHHYCLSFPTVSHSSLLSVIPHWLILHCLSFPILCHSPLSICHSLFSVNYHCLLIPIVRHLSIVHPWLHHSLSFPTVCHFLFVWHVCLPFTNAIGNSCL